ncbi:MAG TPA: cache domain-containing protein [Polyangiaceae bacterium]|nr:cache domain-containing protein [Polyangiaceae bacterium]
MTGSAGAERPAWARIGVAATAFVLVLAIALSWATQRRLDAWFDELDVRAIEASGKVLDQLVAQRGKQLTATAALLSEDARVRAMVLTPDFDRATVLDLLTDLQATSGATMVALLDSDGVVRGVVGAPEMDQLNLGTSSLIENAIEKPSAQLWAFANKVGVLSASPVRLDHQVRALFMLGVALEDELLDDIEHTLGTTGAVFVGDQVAASANRDPTIEQALRSALELPASKYGVIADRFLALNTRLGDAPIAASVAWLVPRYRQSDAVTLTRTLSWLPVALVGLLLALSIALGRGQAQPQAKQTLRR